MHHISMRVYMTAITMFVSTLFAYRGRASTKLQDDAQRVKGR